jgi:hypothetical protein
MIYFFSIVRHSPRKGKAYISLLIPMTDTLLTSKGRSVKKKKKKKKKKTEKTPLLMRMVS